MLSKLCKSTQVNRRTWLYMTALTYGQPAVTSTVEIEKGRDITRSIYKSKPLWPQKMNVKTLHIDAAKTRITQQLHPNLG